MESIETALNYLFDHLLGPAWESFDFVFARLPFATLCVLLGFGFCLPQIYGLKDPKRYTTAARKFARSVVPGHILMALATLWFLYYVHGEILEDFAKLKPYLMFGFLAVGVAACFFVRDFLAVRAMAALFLLLAKQMLDTGRPYLENSPLVLIVQAWAYLLVIAGIWLTISPWRLRDFVERTTASERRTRLVCALRLVFGLLIGTLGLTVFRS